MHTREADHFAQLDPVVITAMAKVSGRTLKLTKFCQWMRAKLHLASVFQGNRKSANIHASPESSGESRFKSFTGRPTIGPPVLKTRATKSAGASRSFRGEEIP